MKQYKHYFVVSFDAKDNTWDWDTEQENICFPDGTVYDSDNNRWTIAHLGDGEYINNEDELSSMLYQHIKQLNKEMEYATNA